MVFALLLDVLIKGAAPKPRAIEVSCTLYRHLDAPLTDAAGLEYSFPSSPEHLFPLRIYALFWP